MLEPSDPHRTSLISFPLQTCILIFSFGLLFGFSYYGAIAIAEPPRWWQEHSLNFETHPAHPWRQAAWWLLFPEAYKAIEVYRVDRNPPSLGERIFGEQWNGWNESARLCLVGMTDLLKPVSHNEREK